MTKIIAFVGMPASGKSEAAKIALSMGIPVVSMGDIVREETARRGIEPTDESTGGVGTMLRREEGLDAIARRCVPRIRVLRTSVVVVDGVRNIEEVECFKKEFGRDFKLIAIEAPLETRLSRIRSRGRADIIQNHEELRRRDEREKGWGLEKAIRNADMTVDNNGTLEEFRARVKKILET